MLNTISLHLGINCASSGAKQLNRVHEQLSYMWEIFQFTICKHWGKGGCSKTVALDEKKV